MTMFTYWEADERRFKTFADVEAAIRKNPFDWSTRVEVAQVDVEMGEDGELYFNKSHEQVLYSDEYMTEQ